MIDLLNDILEKQLDLHYSSQILTNMCNYWDAVKNAPLNLTAIKDDRKAALLHFADSLALLHYADLPSGASLIDVGTGGGFPSVPLSIARSDLKITAIDSTNKKLSFIRQHTAENQLRLIHARAEELARDKNHREQYDFACARAVAPVNILLEYLSPFVRKNGTVIIYKSELSDEELISGLRAASLLNLELEQNLSYTLYDEEIIHRSLLFFHKTDLTPSRFPRKNIRNQPLGKN